MGKLTERFVEGWEAHGLPGSDLTLEFRFHPERRWRFDVAWPSRRVAVELDGMGFGHQSAAGRRADNEKQNAATALGWRVLRYTSSDLSKGAIEDTVSQVVEVLCNERGV